ncbi:MAG: hypothetical protein WAV20_22080 [Blastocatellia bacterium]
MGLTLKTGRVEDLDTPDGHIKFIRSLWREFAAFAWQKYLEEGRGAVVINFRNAGKSGDKLQVPSYYIAEGSERLAKRNGWPNQEIVDLVRDYDPKLDVVFVVLRLNGDIFHYNASDEPPPPRAGESTATQQ